MPRSARGDLGPDIDSLPLRRLGKARVSAASRIGPSKAFFHAAVSAAVRVVVEGANVVLFKLGMAVVLSRTAGPISWLQDMAICHVPLAQKPRIDAPDG